MSYEDMSDDKWFTEDPCFAWGINYLQRSLYNKTQPHEGFDILLKWQKELKKPFFVFTSNIDGQFEKAGFPADQVVACHGDLHHMQCTVRTCKPVDSNMSRVWEASCLPQDLESEIDEGSLRFQNPALLEQPGFRCPTCASLARPNVWFCRDRNYVPRPDAVALRDEYNKWLQRLQEAGKRLVVIECGGGLAIPSVRIEAEDAVAAAGEGSLLLRLNPGNCRVPERAVGLAFGAAEGLRLMDAALQKIREPTTSTSPLKVKTGERGASVVEKRVPQTVTKSKR